ncbi:ATP-dependent DNA ligase [Altererythrobacter soli]|uniref:ATP-dependent DNA ligase n=1 Tax=Croceibacterium soli TaxID=1739690 RepID=A0A6I4UXZ8_9SPHN|nr:non-homologous end-joining DNA ligase [Croceibacterium soli]MXP41855.1 ATP-dependent DNA ligase [Croceibacterium soli]
MPRGFIEPMMPTLADDAPCGDDWQHEIKYDGYRTEIAVSGGSARAFTRNGHDWTSKYRPLVGAAASLACSTALIDGEVIVQDEAGRSDFHSLRAAIHQSPARLAFMAFDLLELDGRDLRRLPLEDRRSRLADLLGENRPGNCLQMSTHIVGSGEEFFAAADAHNLEGIVSKKLGSRYRSGRSKSWLKIKTFEQAEFVVLGVHREPGKPTVALLAREQDGQLRYAGNAAVTLAAAEREGFWRAVEALSAARPAIRMARSEAQWLEPRLRVTARYLRNEETLRHATLTGICDL